ASKSGAAGGGRLPETTATRPLNAPAVGIASCIALLPFHDFHFGDLAMPSVRSLVRSGSQALARHLDQLREALDTLGERLRHPLARAVSQSVAAAVREAVLAVLAEGPPRPPPDERPRDPPPPLWDAPEEPTSSEATAD